ncbi:Y-family DNA polymerase [Enterovibrio coralii]|uniref:UmuC domain-containing protein n=1 Tax=Enterovibrio coralii TaxID=294935 RepID=A0A135IAG6_9GAMM|nr:DNA polymerase Y family protein [Enterovibrio coralii]KXF82432.1 hypothetical protein ATN88_09960 [Enterovibrio coralii]
MTLWLYLHFPTLLLDTLIRDNSTDSPLIVLSRATGHVWQANQAAIDSGIRIGNDLGTASALCHALDVVDYDEQQESARLHQLAALLYQINADIILDAPNGLLMKVTPMLKLYGSLDAYWHALLPVLNDENVQFHYALSPCPEAAKRLARSGLDRGFLTLEATEQALATLSIRQLGLTEKHVTQLERMGVRHAKQLFALPIDALGQRFGKSLTAHIRALTQTKAALPAMFAPPAYFHQSLELLHEIAASQTLCFPIQRMLKEMEKYLDARESVVPEITLTLTQRDDHEPKILTLFAAKPESTASRWMPLLQLHLEKLTLDAPVIHIHLEANTLLPRQAPTQDLFAGKRGQITPGELISLLQAKAGKQGVYSLTLVDDHRPEHAFKHQAPLQTCLQVVPLPLPMRPSLLHKSPRPLLAKPDTLTGPERICSGWWDQAPIQRDYFVARNKRGQLCWVFRTATGEWFEHGLFC